MSSLFKDLFDLRDAVKEAVDPIKGDIQALTEDFKNNVTEIQNIVADPKALPTDEATSQEAPEKTT